MCWYYIQKSKTPFFSQMGVGGVTWHQAEDPNPTLPIWCQIPVETVHGWRIKEKLGQIWLQRLKVSSLGQIWWGGRLNTRRWYVMIPDMDIWGCWSMCFGTFSLWFFLIRAYTYTESRLWNTVNKSIRQTYSHHLDWIIGDYTMLYLMFSCIQCWPEQCCTSRSE